MNTRRFTVHRGNFKAMYAKLRGQDRRVQPLFGATVRFSLWRDPELPTVYAIDHALCVIIDAANGRVRCDAFTALLTAGLLEGAYYGRFDVTLSDGTLLSFPDDLTPLLVLVT